MPVGVGSDEGKQPVEVVKEHQTIDAFDQSGHAFQVGENLLLRNRVLVCQGGDLGDRVDHQRHRAPRGVHGEQLIVRAQRTLWQAEAPAEINDGHNPSLDIDHTEYNLRRGVGTGVISTRRTMLATAKRATV
jgi:hypothetical protein